jgi:hypothetical protein
MADEWGDRRRLLRLVMLAVWIWGSLIALGAALFGYQANTGDITFAPNLLRGAIVESCVLIFLGTWWWLASRRP